MCSVSDSLGVKMAAKRPLSFVSPEPAGSCTPKKAKGRVSRSPQLSPSQISGTESSATVNAVVTSLSPAKDSHKFFQGELSDGDSVVGFEKGHRRQLDEFMYL